MKHVKGGLVGYGYAGATIHAPIIERVAPLDLVCVASSNPQKVHQSYPALKVVAEPEALFSDPAVDLVVIATPNTTHYPLAEAALRAGKHVVLDKPFTNHVAEADALIQLAADHDRVLSVFHNRRWDSDFMTVKQCIASGLLGRVHTYEVHFDRYRPEARDRWREQELEGSGTLYDLGSHLIDQALHLFGLPGMVYADLLAQRAEAKTTDYFHLVLGYEALRVILHGGTIVRQPGPHFAVHGDRGSFIKYGLDSQEAALKQGRKPGDAGWGEDQEAQYGELTTEADGLLVKGRIETLPGAYEAYYEGLARSVLDGTPPPVPAEEARDVIAVIAAAIQSSQQRRVVPFESGQPGARRS